MAKWVKAIAASEVGDESRACVQVEHVPVAIFNVEGRYHAVANICPHAGLPLGDGDRRGHVLTCPFHGYAYNIENGRNVDFPDVEPPVRTFPVRKTDEGDLEIDLEGTAG